MTRDEFASLVGGALVHITPARNAPGIARHGLKPARQLATEAGVDPASLLLRTERIHLPHPEGDVMLNTQEVLRMGRHQTFLDGLSLEDWSRQLDTRLFFWTAARGEAFAESLPGPLALYRLDARRFFDVFAPDIFLSPINSGNAARRAAKRGSWIYVSVSDDVGAFRLNRRNRGLVRTPDTVTEVSLTGPVSPEQMRHLIIPPPDS
ncbi:hypothetical protein [Thalassococcus sp. S3]|uniref:DUF7002 family protein n=1 Tax=Thalassococcus sp. S3 TaxID=2017482 RepID=UPI0010242F4B|nr:hypothetical protein [Thalassococcus sp. S3]QBF31599.1 hypothetical protein CFI11_10275 [Thalassococcus sp. S3]